jgi:ribulose-5-phosphate 4-epimerase/fuculose-1-phosphate aldolase
LANDLGVNWALIMRNHGLLTCGRTIGETFWLMHTLDRACAAQIAAQACGTALHPVSDKAASYFGGLVADQEFSLKLGESAWPSLLRRLDAMDSTFRD